MRSVSESFSELYMYLIPISLGILSINNQIAACKGTSYVRIFVLLRRVKQEEVFMYWPYTAIPGGGFCVG